MVSFSETTSDVTSGILSGTFFIETVGMSRFASGANIIAPSGRVTDPWIAQGYAWNRNVGWIDLN
jgi:hypothetical protein